MDNGLLSITTLGWRPPEPVGGLDRLVGNGPPW
jgi:hypothetical protein